MIYNMMKNIKIYEQFLSTVPEKPASEIRSMDESGFMTHLNSLKEEGKFGDILSSIKIWMKTEQGRKSLQNQIFMEFIGGMIENASSNVDTSQKPGLDNPEWREIERQSREAQKNLDGGGDINPEMMGRIRSASSSFVKDLKEITVHDFMMSTDGGNIIFKKSL
jgi:hypothetical protein